MVLKSQVHVHVFADVITLSSDGSILRAWNLPDGQMVWESTLLGSKASKPLLIIPVSESCLNHSKRRLVGL